MGGKKHQAGFSVIEIIIVLVIIGVLGFIGWRFFVKPASDPNTDSNTNDVDETQKFVEWSFDGNTWKPTDSAPACENPLVIGAPMDVSKANAVLMPGQVRGGDFKPHGGLAIDGAADNKVNVSTIRDAYLYNGSRYIEQGEVQYLLDFIDSCGVLFRLDHLATLTDEVMANANQLPQPKADDSRTERFREPKFFKKGTLIATEVGIKADRNVFFDLGVYDLRGANKASQTDLYKTDRQRIDDKSQSFYAICWFDLLPEKERSTVKSLPERGGTRDGKSDYCY